MWDRRGSYFVDAAACIGTKLRRPDNYGKVGVPVHGGGVKKVKGLSLAFSVLAQIWRHPANRGRRLKALARAVGWQVYKRTLRRHWDLRVFGGLTIRCYPDSYSASNLIYFSEYPEWIEMKFMKDYLRPGDNFVDVGANIGIYTLYAASLVGPAGRIDSFEALPRTVERLRENIKLNGLNNVWVHPFAVSSGTGFVEFVVSSDTGSHIRRSGEPVSQSVSVPCVRLDDALPSYRYAMGKMDIEGAELLALEGAQRLLQERNPPVWLIEMNGLLHYYGCTEAQLQRWMAERGYDLYAYDPESRDLVRSDKAWPGFGNVLAVARSSLEAVMERLKGTSVGRTRA